MNIHLIVILSYSALLMIVGIAIGRRVTTASTFFVAGRRFGPVLVCVSVLAANIGAGSTMGAAEIGYRYGLAQRALELYS